MSPVTEAMLVNGVVLATVLASDSGPARKIGIGRLIRPVIAAAVIIPLFVDSPVTHGRGLLVEVAGVVAGLLGGLVTATLMRVYRAPAPASRRAAPDGHTGSSGRQSSPPARPSPTVPLTGSAPRW